MKEIAKTIRNVKFWSITVFLFVVLTAVSYWATGFVTEGNYIEKYQKLDPLVKELFSLESWWTRNAYFWLHTDVLII